MMNYNKDVKTNINKKSLEELRREKAILMILRDINPELFGESSYSPANPIKHSSR